MPCLLLLRFSCAEFRFRLPLGRGNVRQPENTKCVSGCLCALNRCFNQRDFVCIQTVDLVHGLVDALLQAGDKAFVEVFVAVG